MEYNISNRMKDMRGSAIREIFKYTADPSVISMAGGNPAPELFQGEALAEIASNILKTNPVLALQYGITEGYMPLRETIKARLKRVENIDSPDDDLIVVSGGQQGIELSIKVLINEGDTIIIEEPSFIGATNAFRSYGANLAGVPVEKDGINIEKLEETISKNKNVKLIYTIPTFQNPMGVTMSLEKRKRLYEIAKKNNILILEDNPYGELTFDGKKTPTIKSLDTDGIVLYSGSFSKILSPGLRIGFLCANKELIQKIVIAKQVSDVHTSMLPQLLAYEYLNTHSIDDDILIMRKNYSHKCSKMLESIDKYFPQDVEYTRPGGGLFIWCDLGHNLDTFELSKKAIENKVAFVPGNTFMADMQKPCSALRLNYSTLSDEKIEEGIKRLGSVFADALAGK